MGWLKVVPQAEYTVVVPTGTSDTDRAAKLLAAYTAATNYSPTPLKRATVLIPPGRYDFGTSDFGLLLTTPCVDLVGFDRDTTILTGGYIANYAMTVKQTADDVHLRRLTIENYGYQQLLGGMNDPAAFGVLGVYPLSRYEDVWFHGNGTIAWDIDMFQLLKMMLRRTHLR